MAGPGSDAQKPVILSPLCFVTGDRNSLPGDKQTHINQQLARVSPLSPLSPLSPVQNAMGRNLFAQRVGFAADSAPETVLPDANNSIGPADAGSQ